MTQEMKESNEKKKEYLKSYKESVISAKVIQEEIEQLRLDKMCPSVIADGMPHASTCNDLSSYVAKLTELEDKLIKARYKRIKLHVSISDSIEDMENETEKCVLRLKYLQCKTWEEVAVYLNYSWRQVHNIHSSALNNFIIA